MDSSIPFNELEIGLFGIDISENQDSSIICLCFLMYFII